MDAQSFVNTGLMFVSNLARMSPQSWGRCKAQARSMIDSYEKIKAARDAGEALVDNEGNEIDGEQPCDHFVKTLIYWSIIIAVAYMFTNLVKAISMAVLAVLATLLVIKLLGKLGPAPDATPS